MLFRSQREKWEQDYAAAQARWESHKKQVASAAADELTSSNDIPAGASTFGGSESESGAGTLADDESLAALREKLANNNS